MTLYLYFARKFLWRFLAILASFFIIAVLTDATALFGRFSDRDIGLADTLRLALLKAPSGVYQLLAMVAVLASLMMFRGLSRNSEMVATRAAGQSALSSVMAPLSIAMLIGVVAVIAFNPMAAAALRQFETETGRYESGGISAFSLSREGLWLRQGSDSGQTVIFAERANFDATHLSGVTFFEFSNSAKSVRRIETGFAELKDGAWQLGPGKVWQIGNDTLVPDESARSFSEMTLPSELTSGQILESFGDPSTVSIWDMQSFIDRLERSGFSSMRHRVSFQMELALPLLLAAMVLVGAAFTMRHHRAGRSGLMALITILIGLTIYILQDFAQILGANGAIPVSAAAWGPPVAAILFAVGMILNLEDG